MTSVHAANSGARAGVAVGSGVLAGLMTLAAIGGVLWLAGRSSADTDAGGESAGSRIGSLVGADELQTGDCLNFTSSGNTVPQYAVAACDGPHIAEVTAKIEHPSAGETYPGADAVAEWIGTTCRDSADRYLGLPILETTLARGSLLPDFNEWSAGNYEATCFVRRVDSTSLTASVEGLGSEYPRGSQVVISRLIPGDCFTPPDGTNSYDLNSNSTVNLVPCDGEHNGVFFGRDILEFGIGTIFPGEDEIGDATSTRCSRLFQDHFGVPSDGFNYRYWRPNQQSWDLDDRTILCSVLDTEPLTERFDPSRHEQFFELDTGSCFNLGPEESSDSLRLDDQVRLLDCSEPHIGQMIGSGELEQDQAEAFPGDEGVQQLAGAECERLFIDFVGVSPYESELGNFPFWYPNEPGWVEGDRRYACAFLEPEPRSESLEDVGI